MITIALTDRTVTIARDGQRLTVPRSEAPALLAALAERLGDSGADWRAGYAQGLLDGRLDGERRAKAEAEQQQRRYAQIDKLIARN